MPSEALENQLLLQRLFAGVTEPIERLGAGQLALAQHAQALREAANVRAEANAFTIAREGARQGFEASEHAKDRAARRDLVREERKVDEDRQEKLENIRHKHNVEFFKERSALQKQYDDEVRKGTMTHATAAYKMLNDLEAKQQKLIDDSTKIDVKETNKIVRQVVEGYGGGRYGKQTKKLDAFLNPNSDKDISISLSRVVDAKDLTPIREDISRAISQYLAPKQLSARIAMERIDSLTREKIPLIKNVDPTQLDAADTGGDNGWPSELRGGRSGGAGTGAANPDNILNVAFGGGVGATQPAARTPAAPPIDQSESGGREFSTVNPLGFIGNALPAVASAFAPQYYQGPSPVTVAPDYGGQFMNVLRAPFRQDFTQSQPAGVGATNGISPAMFTRMRAIAMAENPGITDAQIAEGYRAAQAGDPQAIKILNYYKLKAIQSNAAQNVYAPPATGNLPPAQVTY